MKISADLILGIAVGAVAAVVLMQPHKATPTKKSLPPQPGGVVLKRPGAEVGRIGFRPWRQMIPLHA